MLISVVAAMALLILLGIASNNQAHGDLFGAVKPYVYRDRLAILVVEPGSLPGFIPAGKYRVQALHLHGITVHQADKLLNPSLVAAGYRRMGYGDADVRYVPVSASYSTPSMWFLNEIEIERGDTEHLDGVIVGQIGPANTSDNWTARVLNFGKNPEVKPDELSDMKKFLGE